MADIEKDASKEKDSTDADILKEALEQFELCQDAEAENRQAALDDLRFAKLGEQWPEAVRKQRELENRVCITVNRLPTFIRQVVNDSRQNKPSITFHPVEDGDTETAEVMNGLMRNIEYSSNADIAYDTAIDFAVSMGFGYIRVNTDYSYDDAFTQDIKIEQIPNPFSVYGDPHATSADGSDWKIAFVTDTMTKAEFKKKWPDAETSSVNVDAKDLEWFGDDSVRVAEYWKKVEEPTKIFKLTDGTVISAKEYADNKEIFEIAGLEIADERDTVTCKVTQYIISGAEVLETNEWAGKYIPIVPVYGDEVNVEGKRYFISLIRFAKDAQQMHNFWRPLALNTKVPTVNGWSTIGDIKAGDKVFDDHGKQCNVVGKSPVYINRDCFEILFDDNTKIVSDGEHPWVVESRDGRLAKGIIWNKKTVTTKELVAGKHYIDTPNPLDIDDVDLPVDPYVLGYWLGDGASASGRLCCEEKSINELIGYCEDAGYVVNTIGKSGNKIPQFTIIGLQTDLKKAGVLNNKHIPSVYLRASESQRWSLLQGLMDSDGSIGKNYLCSFTNTNEAIVDGFSELLSSLGIKSKYIQREGRGSKLINSTEVFLNAYQFSFTALANEPVFRLTRKANVLSGKKSNHSRRTKRFGIKSITPCDSVPVQCIAVDSISHLFLVGDGMIPTHNTASTELVALAPKAPFIGPVGAFDTDADKWATANSQTHQFLEYDGEIPPQRQPFAGVPAGALQEAMNASDDMKSIMGLYDASMGARSNETSGKAIIARQREGDTSTFHFIDNMTRAIRQVGRICGDLIPKIYSNERMVRVIGEDGTNDQVKVNAPFEDAQGMLKTHDLTAGKYDLIVKSGPSYTTKREEAAQQMMQLIQAFPDAAPIIGDLVAKNLDWPGADDIAKRLKTMLPPQLQEHEGEEAQIPPQVQQAMQQGQMQIQQMGQAIQQGTQVLQQTQAENQNLKTQLDNKQLDHQIKMRELDIKEMELQIKNRELDLKNSQVVLDTAEMLTPKTEPIGIM